MRLRIRTLLLTVALLCSLTSTGRAGIYCPILNPFYWLFGGCGGYGGGDYGSMNTGNNYGHGPNPYGVSRCIDDWLGYGYLRNQEGTLGHYPGRPFSCYNPAFPCLLNPCSWFASCPLFAPSGPACGWTSPMVAPLAPQMQMPYQAQWQNQGQMPQPSMLNPYDGNCNDPCGSQCMPQPMMQYQPAQMPVPTWRPMTVDRGHWRWQRVWVPRPQTMLVPQMQYAMSPQAMPMFPDSMMQSGCGDDCGSECGCGGDMANMLPGSEYMPGTEMMHGNSYPNVNSGSGCCGSESGLPQSRSEAGFPVLPQSTMLMSPRSMPMSGMTMGQPPNIAPYTSMSRWYAHPSYSTAGNNLSYRHALTQRPAYGSGMYHQPSSRQFAYNSARMSMPQATGWQTVQTMPQQFPGMRSQRTMSPQIGSPVYAHPMVAGDIHGDHEWGGPTAVPVVLNSFNGRPPIQQASWSQPTRTTSTRRYPNSVQ